MKKLLTIAVLACAHLAAMSFGRTGDAYVENGVSWQPVHCEESKVSFIAELPGDPSSGLYGPYIVIDSEYRGIDYEVSTEVGGWDLPKSANELANMIRLELPRARVEVVATPPGAEYAIEFQEGEFLSRIAVTKRSAVQMIVDGSDHSLAKRFFGTLKVTRN